VNEIITATEVESEEDAETDEENDESFLVNQLVPLAIEESLVTPLGNALVLNQPLVSNTDALDVELALPKHQNANLLKISSTEITLSQDKSTLDTQVSVAVDFKVAPDLTSMSEDKNAAQSQRVVNVAMAATASSTVASETTSITAPTTSATLMLDPLASSLASNTALDSLNRSFEIASPSARSFLVNTSVPVPVNQPQWSQAVGEKVLWLAAQNVTSAEIRLDPPELGPLQVRVSVHQDQASVSFTSHHSAVREALDQSLNRLRDLFNEQGIELMNVDVSDKSFKRQSDQNNEAKAGSSVADIPDDEVAIAQSIVTQQRLVDHYV
jgi:flagellar hook-length control protein FliK